MEDKKNSGLAWEEVRTEHLVQDEWIDFRRSDYRFPNGKVVGPFYTYSRRDYCVIAATDPDGKYICVRQFRQGIRAVTVEFPAGGLERNDGKEYGSGGAQENALEAAKRELLEETGYASDEWTHLLSIPSNATISDNYAYIFKAENCRKVARQDLDDLEFLNVECYTKQELEKLIHSGDFPQAMHVLAWYLVKEENHETD